jgi:hypothetical protein
MVLSLISAQGLDLVAGVNPLKLTDSRQTKASHPSPMKDIVSSVPMERVTMLARHDGPYITISGNRGLPIRSTYTAPHYLVREGS